MGSPWDDPGEDDNDDILNEQHRPTYLETEAGQPVILVADSENDRVVEYTCTDRVGGECQWDRTWVVGTGQLNWPRDADRLPNGNTLITDTRNHRVIEVTPTGRIVSEATAPWGPFSAEHVGGLADALDDRDAAEDIVRWINQTHDQTRPEGLTARHPIIVSWLPRVRSATTTLHYGPAIHSRPTSPKTTRS